MATTEDRRGTDATDGWRRGLYDAAPATLEASGVDDALLEAIGVRTSVTSLLASPGGARELLDRLADSSRVVGEAALTRLYAALGELDPEAVDPPDRVRVRADTVLDLKGTAAAMLSLFREAGLRAPSAPAALSVIDDKQGHKASGAPDS